MDFKSDTNFAFKYNFLLIFTLRAIFLLTYRNKIYIFCTINLLLLIFIINIYYLLI